MKGKAKFQFIAVSIVILVLVLASCDNPVDSGSGENPSGPQAVDPPENLMGTIALENGSSAVLDLQISNIAPSGAEFSRAIGSMNVTGKVRYEGEDYNVSGSYDNSNGELSVTAENIAGEYFLVNGTYSSSGEFTGTVTLYDSGNVIQTQGAVSGTGSSEENKNAIGRYTGTFGGGNSGSWNGTLTSDRFYGTWASSIMNQSGTFSLNRSGDTVSLNSEGNQGFRVQGTVSDTIVSGSWRYIIYEDEMADVYSGSWSGIKVDSTTLDPPAINSASDEDLLANLLLQAFENGISSYLTQVLTGAISMGDSYLGITANGSDVDTDGYSELYFVFSSFVDSQTGIGLDGELFYEIGDDETPTSLNIDSDVSELFTSPANDGGLTVSLPDSGGTIELYVDVPEIDYDTSSFMGSPVWTLDGEDVLGAVAAVYF